MSTATQDAGHPVRGAGLGLRRALLGPLRSHGLGPVDFLEIAPDLVLVATGAQPIRLNLPDLESALTGKQAGDELQVSVTPNQAYGERDPAKTQSVPRNMFPADTEIEPGMQFHAQGPNEEMVVVTIAEVAEDNIMVDGNHPLAGVHLNFAVEIIDVRDASEQELDHGHVHGPGWHDHG